MSSLVKKRRYQLTFVVLCIIVLPRLTSVFIFSTQQSPPIGSVDDSCTIQRYAAFYASSFADLVFPFTSECLQSLVDSHPSDLHLRVGLVRANYERRPASTRHVVYVCRDICGGLGDRLRAVLNTFYLALAMDASFSIDMEVPVRWEAFFKGLNSHYDPLDKRLFRILHSQQMHEDTSIYQYLQMHKDLFVVSDYSNMSFDLRLYDLPHFGWFQNTDMEYELFQKHSHHQGKEVVALTGLTFRMEPYKKNPFAKHFWTHYRLMDLGRAERSFIFFRLFMPAQSDLLNEAMASYVDQFHGRFVVGMQIRLGGDVVKERGGWKDPHRHSPACVACMADKARELCQTSTLGCTIWATSDTEAAIEEIKTTFANDAAINVLVSTGVLTHIDRSHFQNGRQIEDNIRTFLDWFIMADYSDAFVLSRSGFGEHASWFQLTNATHFKPAFRFKSDTPCVFEDFRVIQDQFSDYEHR